MSSSSLSETDSSTAIADIKHCEICFDALLFELKRGNLREPDFPNVYCGVFITWNKRCETTQTYSMRGCIGSLQPRWLHSSIREYSIKSAFSDSRFQPIWAEEIPFLSCDVSLLFGFESGKDWKDWEDGIHGIIIKFFDKQSQSTRSATYLPKISIENKWNQETTIKNLIRKAGYRGAVTHELLLSVQLTRYQSTLASMTYDEYLKSKENSKLSSLVSSVENLAQ